MAELTETRVKEIARNEAREEVKTHFKTLEKQLTEQKAILGRLERLLIGESGVDIEDTLKARATYAYAYAKRNTELQVVDKALPALEWFEDWNKTQPGCKESRLDSLGKLITLYLNIKWLLGLIGVTTFINALPIIKWFFEWLASF